MNKELNNLLDKARICINDQNFDGLDDALHSINKLNDINSISGLSLLLEDEYDYDEVMFSIIHFIETFEDNVYVEQILNVLPRLYSNAPDWARILIIRIRNNPKTRIIFESLLKDLNNSEPHNIINTMKLPEPKPR